MVAITLLTVGSEATEEARNDPSLSGHFILTQRSLYSAKQQFPALTLNLSVLNPLQTY